MSISDLYESTISLKDKFTNDTSNILAWKHASERNKKSIHIQKLHTRVWIDSTFKSADSIRNDTWLFWKYNAFFLYFCNAIKRNWFTQVTHICESTLNVQRVDSVENDSGLILSIQTSIQFLSILFLDTRHQILYLQ